MNQDQDMNGLEDFTILQMSQDQDMNGLEDFTFIPPKAKQNYVRSSSKNCKYTTVETFDVFPNEDPNETICKCLQFMGDTVQFAKFRYLHSQGKYGDVWRCEGHIGCPVKFR